MKNQLIINEKLTFEIGELVNIFLTKKEIRNVGNLLAFNEKFAIVKVGKNLHLVNNCTIFPTFTNKSFANFK